MDCWLERVDELRKACDDGSESQIGVRGKKTAVAHGFTFDLSYVRQELEMQLSFLGD